MNEEKSYRKDIRDTKKKCIQRLFSATNSRAISNNNFTFDNTENVNEEPVYEDVDESPHFVKTQKVTKSNLNRNFFIQTESASLRKLKNLGGYDQKMNNKTMRIF